MINGTNISTDTGFAPLRLQPRQLPAVSGRWHREVACGLMSRDPLASRCVIRLLRHHTLRSRRVTYGGPARRLHGEWMERGGWGWHNRWPRPHRL